MCETNVLLVHWHQHVQSHAYLVVKKMCGTKEEEKCEERRREKDENANAEFT